MYDSRNLLYLNITHELSGSGLELRMILSASPSISPRV